MDSRVVTVTRGELDARRAEILGGLGMTLAEFREFAQTHALTGPEWIAMDELDGILFLLGEPYIR
jgi:hypothetical protein